MALSQSCVDVPCGKRCTMQCLKQCTERCANNAGLNGQTGVGRRGRRPLHFDILQYKVVKPTGEQCSPLHCVRKFYCRKIASLFADFALYWRIVKRCRVGLRYLLCTRRKFVFLLFLSAPLVGLRRMRLCPFLVSEVEQEIYSAWGFALRPPQWVSPLDPDQGRAPGPFARFARWVFYFALASFFVRRCHSSLLT